MFDLWNVILIKLHINTLASHNQADFMAERRATVLYDTASFILGGHYYLFIWIFNACSGSNNRDINVLNDILDSPKKN